MGKLVILGAGYSGRRIGCLAAHRGWTVVGTSRSADTESALRAARIQPVLFDGVNATALKAALDGCTHLLVSLPPAREAPLNDVGLIALEPVLAKMAPELRFIAYLSTVGVYGGHGGAWINERTPCRPTTTRSIVRLQAERQWQALGRVCGVPVSVLRLSGIYGPGRNALHAAMQGRSRRLIKKGQVFNRIHVDDIARFSLAAMLHCHDGVLNITDNRPAPPQDVVTHAHALCGRPAPEPMDFETAELSPMARSFYGENKRVSNGRSHQWLGLEYRYPGYEQGLEALWRSGHWQAVNALPDLTEGD